MNAVARRESDMALAALRERFETLPPVSVMTEVLKGRPNKQIAAEDRN